MSLARPYSKEFLLMAIDNVRAHKFRSLLTTLGIVIGVMTVVTVSSILTGLRRNIVNYIEEYGPNNIYAFHRSTGAAAGQADREERLRKPLTLEDVAAIRLGCSSVDDVAFTGTIDWRIDPTLSYGGQTYKRGRMQGVSANFAAAMNLDLAEGRFVSELDDLRRRDVIVIGSSVAEAVFPHTAQIVGKNVTLTGKPFEIVGVLEKRRTSLFGRNEEDAVIMIPYRTMRKLSPPSNWLTLIIRAKSGQLRQALDQVEETLRRQRGVRYFEKNNFDLNTADQMIDQFDNITATTGMVAIAVSGVGLLVGGIGVMNIMLVSVTERTREIGVRKALGARRGDIMRQFLVEAMTLTLIGGLIGVILAFIASQIIILLIPNLPASIPPWAIAAGLAVSTATGLGFGVWPARKASRLDPIEALRRE